MDQLLQQILQQVSPELLLQIIALVLETPPEQLRQLIIELQKIVSQQAAAASPPPRGGGELGMGNEQLFGPQY